MSGAARWVLRATFLFIVAAALPAADSAAFYGNGATMVADYARLEQGDDTTVFAAVSADGRYVVIQTRARNFFADSDADPPGKYRAGGVFRYEIATRALEKVADGDLFDEPTNNFLRRGASNPSVSENGRFIAFVTAEPLLPADVNDNADVYVRDMTIPISSPGAFDLVTARDGGDVPATYGPPAIPFPGSNPGSDLSRGVAISADGQKVAFRTDAASDLPASPAADVPSGQVFVRDRLANTTTLVTQTNPGGAPAGGAVAAALSADGTTVTWTGGNAAAQTPLLGGENPDTGFLYFLWRRVADGPGAPTRRITGLADPDDAACPSGSTTFFDQISSGPCYGPLTDQEGNRSGIGGQLPVLSADGYTVAFLTGAGPRPLTFTGQGLDLYVTDMTPGLTRKASTVELTRDSASADVATSSPINSIAMSPDGRYLALATVRSNFSLGTIDLVGAPRAVPGIRELYVADLQALTAERVTRSISGGDIDGDVQTGVSISADGAVVAFTSFAGNLLFGDANQRADAFFATRQPDPGGGVGPGPIDGPGATITTETDGPQIKAKAKSRGEGVIELSVRVPAAGGVKADAEARAGKPPKVRTLATASKRASEAGTVEMVLRPVSRYRAELQQRGKIKGRVRVGFVASLGGAKLNDSVKVTFRD